MFRDTYIRGILWGVESVWGGRKCTRPVASYFLGERRRRETNLPRSTGRVRALVFSSVESVNAPCRGTRRSRVPFDSRRKPRGPPFTEGGRRGVWGQSQEHSIAFQVDRSCSYSGKKSRSTIAQLPSEAFIIFQSSLAPLSLFLVSPLIEDSIFSPIYPNLLSLIRLSLCLFVFFHAWSSSFLSQNEQFLSLLFRCWICRSVNTQNTPDNCINPAVETARIHRAD